MLKIALLLIITQTPRNEMRIEIGFAPKTVDIGNGEYLHFWYANNKGRGDNNCTIIRSRTSVRAALSRNQDEVIASTLTSSWAGNVNFSAAVRRYLGLEGE